MLWKKTWEPEAVLALIGGIVGVFLVGNVAAGLMFREGVRGFKTEDSLGNIMLGTLSFQGAVVALGAVFLKTQNTSWREVLGSASWKRCLALAVAALAVVGPVMFGLKAGSELILKALHHPAPDQRAVELLLDAKTPWLSAYLVFFAVALAPLGEELFFRGLLYSTARRCGWPKLGWIGVSLLFALVHDNAPIFLPLFVLALALTWLYEKTGGLLAPILAHSLFNGANLVLLLFAGKPAPHAP